MRSSSGGTPMCGARTTVGVRSQTASSSTTPPVEWRTPASAADMKKLQDDCPSPSAERQEGGGLTSDELLPLVYGELRRLAHARMAREGSPTPRPSDLVHEAYLRLRGEGGAAWKSRGHFFGAASEAMRRILVERARRQARLKHGGDRRRVPLSQVTVEWNTDPAEIIDVDRALTRLEELEPRVARVVKLRYFAGLSVTETAAVVEVSPRTVERDWSRAKHWLYLQLNS